ncbi:hypothetical protein LCGC14_2132100, partial [marine sediment metagenome]
MKIYTGPYPEIDMIGYGRMTTGRDYQSGYDDGLQEGEK